MVNKTLIEASFGSVPLSRRALIGGAFAALGTLAASRALAQTGAVAGETDVTFLFSNDIHACRMGEGLSPNCAEEGKTDANLLKHITALNGLEHRHWPETVNGAASGLKSAGTRIGKPRGLVIGGDMTDDGGGQTALPHEGPQLLQFGHRYHEGAGPDRVHFPVYLGLGNHDLDQDGLPPDIHWYRRELRDYVELNHRPGVFFKPPVPAGNYDVHSDCYSWNWGRLHLVQAHRFAGDTNKGAVSALPWLKNDLATHAGDGRPVVIFQHYGWDPFSLERWDPDKTTFDDEGSGAPHWWSDADRRAMLGVLEGYNVAGIFHGHQHETPMIYRRDGLDLFKPKAAYMGGFALVRVTGAFMDVVLGEASGPQGQVIFTDAFSKTLG
ncbi:metallophosphoesterase [Mesorhizobium sp. LHD-90]|uniref:metallophosphoesterase n=1 Tax=Mesorhizobium sp. LHD-90 TaxID=3071414 RepID=UPI0027E00A8A|nr:metallophosphoesterase [Mesorhizobium sp. LHD-90]MDQ6433506.1 metallophosphoesterase [Mesorhizobium sp. LHD-90]